MNRNEFLELIKQRWESCGISKYKAAKDSGLTWQQIDFLFFPVLFVFAKILVFRDQQAFSVWGNARFYEWH